MTIREWMLLALLSMVWGGSFFFVEIALRELHPLSVVFGRVAVAACVLWTVVAVRYRPALAAMTLRDWGALFAMGLFNNAAPFFLITWGQVHIDSSLASILIAAVPVFTVILAHYFAGDEPMSGRAFAGVALGFAGVVALVGPGALLQFGGQTLGQLAVLGAAAFYAVANIVGKRLKHLPLVIAAAGMLSGSGVLLALLMLAAGQAFTPAIGAATWAALLSLALLSTALAYLIYFRILIAAGATNLSLVAFLIPINAILLGVFVLDETVEPSAWAGLALIFAGLAVIDGRIVGWLRRW
ncbi:MAG: DMT family transporter [Gammaproteobacteria bacterium]|nr:DMT family transporter [Gammaproteobacteria bacterium]